MRRILSILFTLASFTSVAQTVQTIGAPGTRVVSRGDFITDSILYLPRTQVASRAPFQSGAIRYQASDSTIYQWTGTAWRKLTADIDTNRLSTRAWRQKGIDSVVTLISTLGGGTVLSVGSGYGTNFSTITTSGSVVVDSLVITSRASRDKLKDSLVGQIAMKVNISDTSTMLSAYLRKADTTAMLTPYLRKADTTSMLSPYVRIAGYGLLKGTQTLSVDSALIATRARVQKGIDSVASLVAAPDSLVFSTRAWRQKGDDSLGAIIGTKATATGTTNYLSKFTGTSSLGNSIVYATTSEVGISTPSPTHPLDVNGRVRVRTIDSTASPINFLTTDNDGVIRKTTPFTGTVSSVATGYGLSGGTITSTGTLVADTNSMATRARVQKAVDSLNVNIAAKGSGTVTSVSAGTGMSFTTITSTGSVAADTAVLSTREWRQKGIDSVNSNVALKVNISDTSTMLSPYVRAAGFGLTKSGQSLLVDSATIATRARVQKGIDSVAGLSRVTGSGTTNYLPKWTGTTALGNSLVFDNGTNVLVNTTTAVAGFDFQVAGSMYNSTGASLAVSSGNVGIGLSNPSYLVHVQKSTTDANTFVGQSSARGLFTQWRYNATAGNAYGEISTFGGDNRLEIQSQTGGGHTVLNRQSGNIAMGNNTSPNAKLVVVSTRDTIPALGNPGGTVHIGAGNVAMMLGSISAGAQYIQVQRTDGNTTAYSLLLNPNAGNVGIGTNSPSERLHVNGRARIATIDSTANAINMLYADANGVIKKTAVPASSVTMSTDEMTAASGWTIAFDKTQAYPVNDVNKTVDGSIATVTINTAAYRTTATFNTDQWVHVATVPSGFRPNSDVYFSLPNTVAGASFRSTSSVAFTSYNFYQEETSVRVLPNGNVEVYVGLVSNSADLSGANYVIMPIAVTYNIESYPN